MNDFSYSSALGRASTTARGTGIAALLLFAEALAPSDGPPSVPSPVPSSSLASAGRGRFLSAAGLGLGGSTPSPSHSWLICGAHK